MPTHEQRASVRDQAMRPEQEGPCRTGVTSAGLRNFGKIISAMPPMGPMLWRKLTQERQRKHLDYQTGLERRTLDVLYTAIVEVRGGRPGQAQMLSEVGRFQLAFPASLGGAGDGTNPEQLLAIACGASLGSTLDLEARQRKLELTEISVISHVSLGHGDTGYYALAIELHVHLSELTERLAEQLLRTAEAARPYCRMARGITDLRIMLSQPRSP